MRNLIFMILNKLVVVHSLLQSTDIVLERSNRLSGLMSGLMRLNYFI